MPVTGLTATRVFGQANFTTGGGGFNTPHRSDGLAAFASAVAADPATTSSPSDVAVDLRGNLYVADTGNNRVLVFGGANAQATNGANASAVLGQADLTRSDPATTATGMSGPTGVTVDVARSRLYVADTGNNRVLAFTAAPGTLPVELTSFTAATDGAGAVRLTWTTASETNNSGFSVERQTSALSGGGAWREASAFVAGRGTTSEATSYAVRVEGLAPGRHVFRLRQVDLDGTAVIAGTVEVSVGVDGVGLALAVLSNASASPSVRVVTGSGDGAGDGGVMVTVLDVLGRVVRRESVAGSGVVSLSGLGAGVYVVRASEGARVATATVVVR